MNNQQANELASELQEALNDIVTDWAVEKMSEAEYDDDTLLNAGFSAVFSQFVATLKTTLACCKNKESITDEVLREIERAISEAKSCATH